MIHRTDYVWWIRGEEHLAMARLSMASVRAVHPRAQLWVYSDIRAELDGIACHFDRPDMPAMLANLEAQITHLRTANADTRVLFLDADTLVRKPFPFADREALLLPTWRDHIVDPDGTKSTGLAAIMPYNYGVLGAIADPLTLEAFLWMRARIAQMAPQHQAWYGNQLALAELCGHPQGPDEVPIPWHRYGATRLPIRRLPCETWNYTPQGPGEDVSDKGILHLKGGRKELMEAYQ